jgi:hypothetical protein
MTIETSASQRPNRASRPKQSNTPTSAPINKRLIGEARVQNILEATKTPAARSLVFSPCVKSHDLSQVTPSPSLSLT